MVIDEVSPRRIKRYLRQWCAWWVGSAQSWGYEELLGWFLNVCRDRKIGAYAAELFYEITKTSPWSAPAGLGSHVTP